MKLQWFDFQPFGICILVACNFLVMTCVCVCACVCVFLSRRDKMVLNRSHDRVTVARTEHLCTDYTILLSLQHPYASLTAALTALTRILSERSDDGKVQMCGLFFVCLFVCFWFVCLFSPNIMLTPRHLT